MHRDVGADRAGRPLNERRQRRYRSGSPSQSYETGCPRPAFTGTFAGVSRWVTVFLSGSSRVRHRPRPHSRGGGGLSPGGLSLLDAAVLGAHCAGRDDSCRPATLMTVPPGSRAGRCPDLCDRPPGGRRGKPISGLHIVIMAVPGCVGCIRDELPRKGGALGGFVRVRCWVTAVFPAASVARTQAAPGTPSAAGPRLRGGEADARRRRRGRSPVRWRVRIQGHPTLPGECDTKAAAVDVGRDESRDRGVELIVRNQDAPSATATPTATTPATSRASPRGARRPPMPAMAPGPDEDRPSQAPLRREGRLLSVARATTQMDSAHPIPRDALTPPRVGTSVAQGAAEVISHMSTASAAPSNTSKAASHTKAAASAGPPRDARRSVPISGSGQPTCWAISRVAIRDS